MESKSLPKNIDYSDVLPQSVPAIARRRKFYSSNGANFSFGGSRDIRIDIQSVNSMLDTTHSYLEFVIENKNAAGATFGADVGGGAVFFDTLRIEQGGRVLSECQEFNRFNSAILSPAQESHQGQITQSLTGMNRAMNAVGAGVGGYVGLAANGLNGDTYGNCKHNGDNVLAPGAKYRFTMPVLSGLFTQDKLLPLPLLKQGNPLTIVLTCANPEDTGVWSAQPASTDLEVISIHYNAQLIEVGRDVIEQVKTMQGMMGGQIAISGQDYEHQQGVIPAASDGEQLIRIPSRKKSIKSLLFMIQSDTFANGAVGMARWNRYNLSFAGTANVTKYQLKVGSVVYPPQPVEGFFSFVDEEFKRGESIMELSKALGTLGFKNPSGRLNTITYGLDTAGMATGDTGAAGANLAPGANSVNCFCPFGLDLDSFQHTAIEGGVDTQTLGLESNLSLEIEAGQNSGVQAKNVHCYVVFDQHYYFGMDGMITFAN